MKKSRFVLIGALLSWGIILISCGNYKSQSDYSQSLIVDVPDFTNVELDFESIVSNTEVLRLYANDTTEFVADIQGLCLIDSFVYILDASTTSVSKFNKYTGMLIKQICTRGNGPNEYVSPVGLTADQQSLYLLDFPMQKIIQYNKDLSAIREFRIPCQVYEFVKIKGGFLGYNLHTSDSVKQIVCFNDQGQLLNSFIERKYKNPSYTAKIFSKDKDGKIYVMPPYSQTVYTWDEDTQDLVSYFSLDFGTKNTPSDIEPDREDMTERDCVEMYEFFKTDSVLINSFLYKGKRFYHAMSTNYSENRAGVVSPLLKELPFYPRWQIENLLVGTCEYGMISKYMKEQQGEQNDHYGDVLLLFTLK